MIEMRYWRCSLCSHRETAQINFNTFRFLRTRNKSRGHVWHKSSRCINVKQGLPVDAASE